MTIITQILRPIVSAVLVLTSLGAVALAQEVSIPDPGLNDAVRVALQKPNGPLTEQDMLSLTNLSAGGGNVTNVAGLESARNLHMHDLDNKAINAFTIGSALTNLSILDLFNNRL